MGTPFTSSGFSVQSASQRGINGVRVRFTYDPLAASSVGVHDALNPSLYGLSGPALNYIAHAAVVPDDPQSIDLTTQAPLAVGTWTLSVSDQLQTATGSGLAAPRERQFTVSFQAAVDDVAGGAKNDSAEALIRKHLPSSLIGRAWDALIAALAVGDRMNWDTAKLAFDQLFKSTASGVYLDRLAADDGLGRPPDIGMPDDLFRQLAIKTSAAKLTPEVILEILEVFYGADAVRASAATELSEPFVLADGDDLELLLDERDLVAVYFSEADFGRISQATAKEVAVAITRALRQNRSKGYAISFQDPVTNLGRVRVYSGSLGLGSSIRITGGRAQLGLHFPALLPVYSSSVTASDGYNWAVSAPTSGSVRLQLSSVSGASKVDLNQVQAGDYLIFEAVNSSLLAGVYQILDVSVSFSGTTLVQYLDIAATADDHSFLQLASREMTFFRPERKTIQAGGRTVVLAQTAPSSLDVVIPATTQAVGRGVLSASYLHDSQELDVTSFERVGAVAKIGTGSAHGLQVGDQVLVEEAWAGTAAPTMTVGSPGVSGGPGSSDASVATTFTQTRAMDGQGRTAHQAVQLDSNRILVIGGQYTSGVTDVTMDACTIFRVSATTVLGSGAKQYTYNWDTASNLPSPRSNHRACLFSSNDPANAGNVLVTGGLTTGVYLNTTAIFTPNSGAGTWSAGPAMVAARRDHEQILLNNTKILLIGGASNSTTGLSSCEAYDPATGTFGAVASMSETRVYHAVTKLADGRILVTGGRATPAAGATLSHTCEIYDPSANTWTRTGSMTFARAGHTATTLGDGRVMVAGGVGKKSAEAEATLVDAEIWDPNTGCWYPAGRLGAARSGHGAVYLASKQMVLVAGGTNRAEYFDTRTLSWRFTPNGPMLVTGVEKLVLFGADLALLVGGQNPDTSALPSWLYQPGDDMYGAGGLNGQFQVATVPSSTSFTYKTPDYLGASTNQNGSVRIRSMAALDAGEVTGPFLLDPLDGAAVTSIETDVTMDLAAGKQYPALQVADATIFPDEEGWLAINFGTDTAVYPIRYLGRQSATSLILDYSFKFPSFASGVSVIRDAKVTWLKQKGRYAPEHPEQVGAAYITASGAGRQAAVKALADIGAAGIDINVEVTYPSDRGLGGEGLPVAGQRLSDKLVVWGGDNLQDELATARGETDG